MPITRLCEICAEPFRVAPYRLRPPHTPPRFCSRPCTVTAQKRGLIRAHPPGSRKRKYVWEPWQIALIRDCYDSMPGKALAHLCERLPFPRHAIRSKAHSLGLGRKLGAKHRAWSDDEVTYLHDHLATMPLEALAQRLGRTKIAIGLKAKQLGISKSSDGYTLRQLEPLLGMDAHKTRRMITTGLLKATRKHTERQAVQGGDMFHVTDEALKAFIVQHPEHIDLRRVDREWLIDLLTDGALWRHRFTAIAAAIA